MPKFSIITINYNNKEGLEKTILSVTSQTNKDYEYIIIDGGSTDGSVDIIKKYEKNITYWVSEKDKGIYNALNKGIQKATGKFLNFMNSGDLFHSERVLEAINEHTDADIIYGKYKKTSEPVAWYLPTEEITMYDLYKGTLNHQAAFIRRKLFEHTLYDENLKIVSDWKFFVQKIVLENCTFKRVDTIVAVYDTTGFSSTHKQLYKEERSKEMAKMLPPRVCKDYEKFIMLDYDALELIPQIYKYPGIYKSIIRFAKLLIKIRTLFS